MKKLIYIGVIAALAFILGIFFTRNILRFPDKIVAEQQQVLLEKIREVNKLVTVEGQFSEIYDYKDYYGYDLGLFRKKALIRVKATVTAGYDLSNIEIESFPDQRKVVIKNIPEATIMSIDHDLDYYDLSEGTFNRFSTDDLNQLNKKAKSFIEAQAMDSDLLQRAEAQGQNVLNNFKHIVESNGWTLEVNRNTKSILPG